MLAAERCALVRDLFEAHFQTVYGYLRSRLGPQPAEAMAQRVFLGVLSASANFGADERIAHPCAFLLRCAQALLEAECLGATARTPQEGPYGPGAEPTAY